MLIDPRHPTESKICLERKYVMWYQDPTAETKVQIR